MGCWNETDGVTQLPIHCGDKVRVFVLRGGGPARREGGGTCYINDIWSPIGPPITGHYDDYGGVEHIDQDVSADMLLDAIKENWPNAPLKDTRGEKIKSLDEMELKDALYYIERDYVKLKGYQGEDEKLGIMFVLEDVYQAMISYNPIDADFSTQPFIYKSTREIYENDVKTYYTQSYESFKQLRELKGAGEDTMIRLLSFRMDIGGDSLLFHDYRDRSGQFLKKAIRKCAEDGKELNDPNVQELLTMTVNTSLLYNAMTSARKFWTPQTGKGGQHSELDIYRIINKASIEVMDKRDKRWAEENIDEPLDENGYSAWQLKHNAEAKPE